MKRWKQILAGSQIVALGLLALALGGCQGSGASADAAADSSDSGSFFSAFSSKKPQLAVVPAGSRLRIRLLDGVSTERNSTGDRFEATLDGPLEIDGKLLAPARSRVIGRLTEVTPSGRVEGRARMTLALQKLVVGEEEFDLSTEPLVLVAPSTRKKDAKIIGGTAAAGALIGAIAGGGKGAAIGAGVGGGSGTGYVLATKGAPVAYGPEARFTFTLSGPVEMPVYSN